ncbi:hypothetical protein TNIN_395791 [Trichonephila inaurata madagascariensis]|uniref:Uncharacterized protein n=1 Tax=Trichonephila inaurata madagascariensis TaxID=2747483 RepID=A0A8X6IYY8_9ARAC|nr:hypothetical protein TNIN_395791 [Trichonephila inaurata madagascariensis]
MGYLGAPFQFFKFTTSSKPVVGDAFKKPSHVFGKRPKKRHKNFLGFLIVCYNFVHPGKTDISKLGVFSIFQANFHHYLHTGYPEKIKKKGTFLFGHGGTKSLSHHDSRSGGAERADLK